MPKRADEERGDTSFVHNAPVRGGDEDGDDGDADDAAASMSVHRGRCGRWQLLAGEGEWDRRGYRLRVMV